MPFRDVEFKGQYKGH